MLPSLDHPHRRILVLAADAGLGHRRAAQAIAAAFADLYGPACECMVVNPAEGGGLAGLVRQSQRGYDQAAREQRAFYRATYEASDSAAAGAALALGMTLLLGQAVRRIMAAVRPHAVISTYHLYLAPLAEALRSLRSSVPFFAVVTDWAAVHRLWFHPRAAATFVSSEQVRQAALAAGVAASRLVVSGVPVDARRPARPLPKAELKRALGWDPELPAVLAVGSKRTRNMIDCMRAVDGLHYPVQLVAVAGGDATLHAGLRATDWRVPVHLYDWVDDLPRLMRAADVLVTKAGGLVVGEALACGLPMILVDAIPGQETGNVAFVCDHRAGVVATEPARVITALDAWLADSGAGLARATQSARLLGRPDAAYRVAETVWQAVVQPQSPIRP